jgi:hypothetical protein
MGMGPSGRVKSGFLFGATIKENSGGGHNAKLKIGICILLSLNIFLFKGGIR